MRAAGLVAAIMLSWPGPSFADQVQTRAWSHGQYGRIVFDWPSPVRFNAQVSGETLTVAFERPIATSLDFVRRNLGQYITHIAVSADGRSVIATLKRPLRMRSFVNNKAVVVDLMVPAAVSAGGARPARGEASSSTAKPETSLRDVRTGKHLGFGRIVFDWTGRVSYNVSKSGAHVEVQFDQPARFDLGKLKATLPKPLTGVTASLDSGRLSIKFAAPGDARVRHFRDGLKIVVDVLSSPGRNAAKGTTQPPPPRKTAAPAKPATAAPTTISPKKSAPATATPRPLALVPKAERETRKASTPDNGPKRRLRRHAKTFGPRAAIVTVNANGPETISR